MSEAQSFRNHAKIVPAFHYVVLPIFAINLVWSIYRMVHAFSAEAIFSFLMAIAFLLLAFQARIFALTVQDRVIRLEMRLRLHQELPADLPPRIPEFSAGQLVALRFAGEAELPGLARKVLEEKIADRAEIKKMVRDWQPDTLRA